MSPESSVQRPGSSVRRAVSRVAAACAALVIGLSSAGAQGDSVAVGVRIGLKYDPGTKPGVIITPVTGANADSVREMLWRDLDQSDRITALRPDGDAPAGQLNYALFAQLGAIAVVQASVTPAGALHVVVHDVVGKQVMGVIDEPLPAPPLGAAWRHMVHLASDSVEKFVTGQRGVAATRILFTRENQLWTIDADGGALQALPGTEGGLTPAWHPNGKSIAFSRLPSTGRQRIVLFDVQAGKELSSFIGHGNLNTAPVFSPNGSKVVFASGEDGSDLYEKMVGDNEPARRLTSRHGSTNSSPTFSPDGSRIAFTSGVLGHPEVYIMDADGTSADILTSYGFGEKLYRSSPAFSPDGRRVAFESKIDDVLQLMTISVRDKSTLRLTSEGENESPSWAPDGRHLVFISNRSGSKELWVLDTESFRTRQLTRGNTRRTRPQFPAWSPRLSQ